MNSDFDGHDERVFELADAVDGHDQLCEAEFISGPMLSTACQCSTRTADSAAYANSL